MTIRQRIDAMAGTIQGGWDRLTGTVYQGYHPDAALTRRERHVLDRWERGQRARNGWESALYAATETDAWQVSTGQEAAAAEARAEVRAEREAARQAAERGWPAWLDYQAERGPDERERDFADFAAWHAARPQPGREQARDREAEPARHAGGCDSGMTDDLGHRPHLPPTPESSERGAEPLDAIPLDRPRADLDAYTGWAQMDEGQRTDYLGERAAELTEAVDGAAVHERMDRDGVPPERRWEVTATADAWRDPERERKLSPLEVGALDAAHEREPDPGDPFAGPWEGVDGGEADRIDAEREASEQEAIEDETQPGGPLWNPETGQPYDQATQERLINEARYAAPEPDYLPERGAWQQAERDVGRGREAGQ